MLILARKSSGLLQTPSLLKQSECFTRLNIEFQVVPRMRLSIQAIGYYLMACDEIPFYLVSIIREVIPNNLFEFLQWPSSKNSLELSEAALFVPIYGRHTLYLI